MIQVLYFARLAETLGLSNETVEAAGLDKVSDLLQQLQQRGAPFADALADKSVLVSVNQEMARLNDSLKDGDEVAFFPPVTGG